MKIKEQLPFMCPEFCLIVIENVRTAQNGRKLQLQKTSRGTPFRTFGFRNLAPNGYKGAS